MAVERVAVIGAGTMGAGIAQIAAVHGCSVQLVDSAPGAADAAIERIRALLDRAVERDRMTAAERDQAMGRLRPAELDDLADAEYVVEAVAEDLEVKQQVFRALERAAPNALLATNTSSLSITEIASAISEPGRVAGMHFFNPAPLMPLVEVVAGDASDAATVALVAETARAWEKVPARVKDTPGFIVNRVARSSYVEAYRMLDEGVAGPDVIDGAMRTLGQFRMGPLQLTDLIGLEVNLAVTESVWERSGRPLRFEPPVVQKQLAERGEFGQKSGRGVYDYSGDQPVPNVRVTERPLDLGAELSAAIETFVARAALCDSETLAAASEAERYAFARILGSVLNEAARTRDEGVATPADIDVALQRGTNYPKGPIAWIEDVGAATVSSLLRALDAHAGDGRFAPAPSLA